MAHVQISQESSHGPLKIVIDDVDMSHHIYNEGFGLVRVGDAEWGVSMILAADSLDLDLPDAVLNAIVRTDEDMTHRDAS